MLNTYNATIFDPRAPKENAAITSSVPEDNMSLNFPRTIVRWLINEDTYMRYENHRKLFDDTKYIPALKTSYPAHPIEPNNIDIMKISRAELGEVKKVIKECETLFP